MNAESQPSRIDPPNCGCTDCLTGYSRPAMPGEEEGDISPAVETVKAQVAELSVFFGDYTPKMRAKYEGTHIFVGVHVPIEYAKHLTCSTEVTVGIEVTR